MKSLIFLLLAILLKRTICELLISSNSSTSTFTHTSITKSISCHSYIATVTSPPATVPTSNYTYLEKFTTSKTITLPVVITVNGSSDPRTSTVFISTTITTHIPPQTISEVKINTQTIGTLTLNQTLCSNRPPNSTRTVYTATSAFPYTSRTLTPFTFTYPTSFDCYTNLITGYTQYTTSIASNTSTTTLHPLNPSSTTYTTITNTNLILISPTPKFVTLTVYTNPNPIPFVALSTNVVTSACSPTITRTLDAKCAPTNLINNAQGGPIDYIQYPDGMGVIVDYTSSTPSECCQRCLDNKGCAGMVASPKQKECFFHFSPLKDGTCVKGFNISAIPAPIGPDDGFLVQSGCAAIAASSALPPSGGLGGSPPVPTENTSVWSMPTLGF